MIVKNLRWADTHKDRNCLQLRLRFATVVIQWNNYYSHITPFSIANHLSVFAHFDSTSHHMHASDCRCQWIRRCCRWHFEFIHFVFSCYSLLSLLSYSPRWRNQTEFLFHFSSITLPTYFSVFLSLFSSCLILRKRILLICAFNLIFKCPKFLLFARFCVVFVHFLSAHTVVVLNAYGVSSNLPLSYLGANQIATDLKRRIPFWHWKAH